MAFGKITPDTTLLEFEEGQSVLLSVEVVNRGGDLEHYRLELRGVESSLECELPLELSVGAGDTSTARVNLRVADPNGPSKEKATLVLLLGDHEIDSRTFDVTIARKYRKEVIEKPKRRPQSKPDNLDNQEHTTSEPEPSAPPEIDNFKFPTEELVELTKPNDHAPGPEEIRSQTEPSLKSVMEESGDKIESEVQNRPKGDGVVSSAQSATIVTRKESRKTTKPSGPEESFRENITIHKKEPVSDPVANKPQRIRDQEQSVVSNPVDGQTISMGPDSRKVLTFDFKNGPSNSADYFLNVDAAGLPDQSWIVPIRPQVKVDPNDENDLGFAIVLPEARLAPPKRYEIVVTYGSQQASQHEEILINLVVEPELAVRVSCELPRVSVGPFGRTAKSEVLVSNQGNASTAYRLAVTDDSLEGEMQPLDCAGAGSWDYTTDWELSDSKYERDAKSRAHKLTVRCKGIWWFGFKEGRKVTVAAQPVTASAGRNMVATQIDISFWRILPLSWILVVPLVALCMWLLRGPNEVILNVVPGESLAMQLGSGRWLELLPKGVKESRLKVVAEPAVDLQVRRAPNLNEQDQWIDFKPMLSGSYADQVVFRPKFGTVKNDKIVSVLSIKGTSEIGVGIDLQLSATDSAKRTSYDVYGALSTHLLDSLEQKWKPGGSSIDGEESGNRDLVIQIPVVIPKDIRVKGGRIRCFVKLTNPMSDTSVVVYFSSASRQMEKFQFAQQKVTSGFPIILNASEVKEIRFDVPVGLSFDNAVEWRFFTSDVASRCVIMRFYSE
ncbi:MAG TPA: hypothetical protein PKA27_13565 [Fimbriimonadaceae bacterium]|nr:hypothetical protein [Fimbriimonadaceae bacterium]